MAWYRLRATFRRRWAGYMALILLIGLVGGIAMASVVAARRTYASYPRFLASTKPSDLVVQPFTQPQYSPGFVRQLARLPQVRGIAVAVPFTAVTLTPHGKIGTVLLAHVQLAASLGAPHGLYSSQDRVTILRGRKADPARPDEVVASPDAAALLHLHVGSHLRVGLINPGHNDIPARQRVDLTVVGIAVFNTQVLQDGIDSGRTGFLLGTPALARQFASCCASGMNVGLRLDGGSRSDTLVGREYRHLVATSSDIHSGELYVYITSAIEAQAQRAIRPEAIALAIFGMIAGLATLIIATQSIARQIRAGADDTAVLRALGAGPVAIMADRLPGIVSAIAVGSLVAVAVAISLSPFSLFGPVREAEPGRGVYLDWPVIGLGALGLVLVLGGVAAVIAYRQAPHRVAARGHADERTPAVVRTALAARLPAAGVEGLRLALEPGRGDRSADALGHHRRGAGHDRGHRHAHLRCQPDHLDHASGPVRVELQRRLLRGPGLGLRARQAGRLLLSGDQAVAATTGVNFVTVQLDGQTVPAIAAPTHPAITPRILSGHGLGGPREVVLGPATLAQLHKRVGDTVTLASGDFHVRLRIAGTGTMPAIGGVLSIHPSMSTGALFSTALIPANASGAFGPLLGRPERHPGAAAARRQPGIAAGDQSTPHADAELAAGRRPPPAVPRSRTPWISWQPSGRPRS